MPTLYIIAGCNGAGKTTASYTILPKMLNCKEFVNADIIASGLSPFQPEKAAFEAGRLMLQRINQLIKNKTDFAFETTLSTRSYEQKIKACKRLGYEIILVFFWLNSPKLAIARVKERVRKGGHNISEEVIKRRYLRGLQNLFNQYIPLSDCWFVIDNSHNIPVLIAEGKEKKTTSINNLAAWKQIKSTI